jgi:hypothetical protein
MANPAQAVVEQAAVEQVVVEQAADRQRLPNGWNFQPLMQLTATTSSLIQ